MDTDHVSRLRKDLCQTRRQIVRLFREVMRREPVVRGIVYKLRRKCGKPGCRCSRGEWHESWVFSALDADGIKRLRPVPRGVRARWRALTQRYRRARKARAQLVKWFAEALRIIDALEQERTVKPPEG